MARPCWHRVCTSSGCGDVQSEKWRKRKSQTSSTGNGGMQVLIVGPKHPRSWSLVETQPAGRLRAAGCPASLRQREKGHRFLSCEPPLCRTARDYCDTQGGRRAESSRPIVRLRSINDYVTPLIRVCDWFSLIPSSCISQVGLHFHEAERVCTMQLSRVKPRLPRWKVAVARPKIPF